MSRRRSSSNAMGPPPDRDVVMGPPPVPAPTSSTASPSKSKDGQDINEKYRKLKRRFFELEEKHKETSSELQRSSERNVRIRQERNVLLERIMELEALPQIKANGASGSTSPPDSVPLAQPASSAFPRSLLNARARTSFVANLREAVAEDDAGEDDVDPTLSSRHVGPAARKRAEEERKEREEEDSRDTRRGSRNTRRGQPTTTHSVKGKEVGGTASPGAEAEGDHAASGSGLLVSSSGTRLRIRPPAVQTPRSPSHSDDPASPMENAGASSSSSSARDLSLQRQSPLPGSSYTHPPPPHFAHYEDPNHYERSVSPGGYTPGDPPDGMVLDDGNDGQFPSPGEHGNGEPNSPTFPLKPVSATRTSEPAAGVRRSGRPRRSSNTASRADQADSASAAPRTRSTRSKTAAAASAASSGRKISSASANRAASPAPPSDSTPARTPTPLSQHGDVQMGDGTNHRSITPQEHTPAPSPVPTTFQAKTEPPAVSPIVPAATPVRSDVSSMTPEAGQPPHSQRPEPVIDPSLSGESPGPAQRSSTGSGSPAMSTNAAASTSASAAGSSSTPTTPAVPMGINPYSLYFPTPGTPVTPNTPTYSNPYANPYFYMTGAVPPPMFAAPNAGYPQQQQQQPPRQQREPSDVQRAAKPKRLKAHTVVTKSYSIPMVPRDKRQMPMLPLNVGIMTVICLGEVCMREHFHTERRYLSTIDPNVEVVYHCTILDGGDGPKFQIVAADVPDKPIIAGTATGAWSGVVKQANAIRQRQHSNSVSGPDFFGLGQNTIKHLIQELPNANKLKDYVWQNFVEGGPLGGRHAAVIPALPEEYDASMPIGAYYPTERDRLKREGSQVPESPRTSHYPPHIMAQQRGSSVTSQPRSASQSQVSPSPTAQLPSPAAQQQGQPANQFAQQSQQQQGLTQIVLPPPTTSEMLNIQEYEHPNGGVPGAPGQGVPATFATIMNAYNNGSGPGPSG